MKLYYVTIHVCIELSFFEYDITYHFNSKDSMEKWIKSFNERKSTLRQITAYGESKFNKIGMLEP